jgi:flagellar biosynthesis GTPase FlhF
MADTPNPGETAKPGDVKNDVSPASDPKVDNTSTAEVEQLRKEAEQAKMRANQLQNELEDRRKKEDEVKQKQMEEQEEYKQLYEKTNAELSQLQDEKEAQATRSQLDGKTTEILKDYPEAVARAAQIAGLTLLEDSETAIANLKGKLDDLKTTVSPSSPAPDMSANPRATAIEQSGVSPAMEPTGLGKPHTIGTDDGQTPARPEANPVKVHEYIRGLSAIDRMKMDSGYYKASV